VLNGTLKCHGFLLKKGASYRFDITRGNPYLLMQNLSEKAIEGASSNLHTSQVKIEFNCHFKDGPEDGLFLDVSRSEPTESEPSQISEAEECDSSSEIKKLRDCFIAYEPALSKRLAKLINYLQIDDSPVKLIFVVGAKKVGKTTLCHFISNSILQKHKSHKK
jgi:chromosomal replication initiation ATPase DnaA